MTNKDYVKRGGGNSPRKKKNAKPSNKASSGRFPWKVGVTALVALSAFGYGIYQINQVPDSAIVPPSSSPVTPKVEKKETKPLPTKPEEKYRYAKELETWEVEVVDNPLPVSKVPYIMQCGAFKTLKQAEDRKVSIAFLGLQSEIKKTAGSSWYRVVLGPYTMKRAAEKDRHKLQRAKIEPCKIWKDNS
ncbi:SPOR domain-containing protein [Vibrio sp.]|nr:SPOR domain-containing protein [Vibrio sp.]